jgi:hypothetical protein
MKIPIYHIDAFTGAMFSGNPAAVCPLENWPDDSLLQSIAAENYLPATAFFVAKGAYYELRWFTPTTELDLCGHGTLAAAFVIFNYLDSASTIVGGKLAVRHSNVKKKKEENKVRKNCGLASITIGRLTLRRNNVNSKARWIAMYRDDAAVQAESDYQKALRQAFWRKVRRWLGRGCNDLLSFGEIFQHLKKQPQSQLGIQTVPLAQIVGSTGRYHDFDLAFYPLHRSSDKRWVNVARSRYQGVEMPPVLLYKVGQAYFVEDGNHRISVARANGEKVIEARVIELDTSNLRPQPACTRLGYKLEEK